ncbi:protein furry homolog-like isoform X1 [Asterias rubens]|uniref:protein furry homolog-like isoform X1 n=1 Tax=Asterias rubens TaxID=7604 RepID=UPI0014555C60|nr:protein furry homolog-like isoform X1 [Asterias rubens]
MSESGAHRRKKKGSMSTSVSQSENLTGSVLSLATSTSSDTLSLPWIRVNDPSVEREPSTTSTIMLDTNVKPGQYVLQSLFAEFTIQAERKIEKIMAEPLDNPLAKSLQRGEDPQFDQLLSSLSAVAEHCLPSLLKTLFDWYELQNEDEGTQRQKGGSGKSKGEKDYVSERRDLAVDFLYCLVLIEVLKQLHLHPVPDIQLNHIETLAFKHFKHRDSLQSGPNTENFHIIADLYAEVLGVLAKTRFMSVRKRFLIELKELRSEPQNVQTTQAIISLIMGMKFYRVKMFPVEDFEASFQLLHECANYYLEVKDKDIKHALAGLLVEILVPVASCVMNEVNIPVLKNFVDKLYQTTLDQCSKKKHALAAFPLLTCLLCVSQKQFFLSNWCNLLNLCLTNLNKHRDPKMSRVALESLYRLLWVYVIRIKCESNMTTQIRLQSIVNCLFPKGSRNVVPRDTPLNIFVKILQFIAQEKLEFAMRDVIFDLLGVTSKQKVLCPERMNIGLRAFLVVADDLQQKDGVPPMPTTTRIMPSGNTLRVRKTFLNKQLTEDAAKSIGVLPYYPGIRKAMDGIIKSLDAAVGRALLMTNVQCLNKELDDLMTSERRPKIELFRTCVAAIPRVIPDGMSRKDLLELLARLTVHRDDELRGLAFTSLQNVVLDLPEWRDEVLNCFINFILRDIADTFPLILESALKMLLQLLSQWRTAVQSKEQEKVQVKSPYERNPHASILNTAEGFAVVFLCSCRPLVRRLSYFLLKEVRALFGILGYSRIDDDAVIDVVDRACPGVVDGFVNQLPPAEKATITAVSNIDLHWVVERSINQWSGSTYESTPSDSMSKSLSSRGMGGFNPWITCLARFFDSNCLPHFCPAAVSLAWPVVHTRLTQLYTHIDPNAPSEGRTSIRSKKTLNPMDENISLWRNYLVFACSCAPPCAGYQTPRRCMSPDPTSGTIGEPSHMDRSEVKGYILSPTVSAGTLFKMLVPLIKCDNTDTREAVVNGLGWTNNAALRDLLDELQIFIKDAVERKQENMRRKRRRDFLRVHLIRVFELLAEHGVFKESFSGSLNKDGQALHNTSVLAEYIEGMRLVLETEGDKDSPTLHEIRLHYSGLVSRLIKSIPAENRFNVLPKDVRYSVFFLCGSLCRKLGVTYGAVDRSPTYKDEPITDLEMEALQAMCGLLVCGEVFDSNALSQEGYLYTWLDNLLNCNDERVVQLGKETVLLLLQNNPQQPMVLRWAIYRCYTGPVQVANGYFQAMAAVFNNSREVTSNHSEYPCEVIPTLCVILFKTADPYSMIRCTALQLLQVLDKRFFGSDIVKSTMQATHGKTHKILSHELARLHPELTLTVFSEITERFESAPLNHRKVMLEILLPWLYNVELVGEPNKDISSISRHERDIDPEDQDHGSPLKTCGWGSKQASDIVLNNLFFITSEYGDDHSQGLEQLWAALCRCWSGNLRHILTYLMTLASIMTNPDLLPYVKNVMTFVARAKPQKLMDELMKEMFSIELVNSSVERTEEVPYFQLFNQNKFTATSPEMGSAESLPDKLKKADMGRIILEKGTVDRRSSGGALERASTPQSSKSLPSQSSSQDIWKERDKSDSSMHHSNSSLATLTSTSTHSSESTTGLGVVEKPRLSPAIKEEKEEEETSSVIKVTQSLQDQFANWRKHFLTQNAVLPLPVPDEVYCAPLSDFIDDIEAPPSGSLFRCNLATVLMTDLVSEKLDIDWSVHLPQILHVLFLGLDHSWPTVHEHCKRLLLNLLIVLSPHNDYVYIAQMLLSHQVISDLHALTEPIIPLKEYNFTGGIVSNSSNHPADNIPSDLQDLIGLGSTTTISAGSTISVSSAGSAATVIPCGINGSVQINVDHLRGDDETAKALIEFLVTRKCRPLWSCEEITSKVFSIKSAEQIETFLRHVVRVFQGSVRGAHLEQRWSQLALSMALSCPSRHYAGRSFQIFRALSMPLTSRMLSEILSRLVETVAEQGEETQGYVTEILLTLESSIDVLASELVFSDHRERCKTGSSRKNDFRKSTSNLYNITGNACGYDNVKRHSIASAKMMENAANAANNGATEMRPYSEHRARSNTASEIDKPRFPRSRSTQSIKMGESSFEDRLNLLSQVFWIFVSLLESDYEYEFLMALRSLDKLMKHLPLDRSEVKNKLEHVLSQLKWEGFPGLQALLLKGFTSSVTSDLTLLLVSRLTGCTHLRVIDPTQAAGFPLNIVALLPYLIQHFDLPDKLAMEIAHNIGKVCQERYTRMAPLSTVLTMYRDRTYNRDSKAWTSVVCRYIHNAYSQFSIAMMTFLIEVLEKGPMCNQAPVLQIVYNLIHNIDLMAAPMQQVNDNLLRVIARYVQGVHWQESLNILKVAVSKSSSLVKPPSNHEDGMGKRSSSLDLVGRKELPGRTMEFTFDLSKVVDPDVSNTPVIRRKFPSMLTITTSFSDESATSTQSSDDSSMSTEPTEVTQLTGGASNSGVTSANQSVVPSAWRKPQLSMRRTRERLVNVLHGLGQKVGLPRSPSVIFSSTSDITQERQNSLCSSSESTSLVDAMNPDKQEEGGDIPLLKVFDFLEGEEGEQGDEKGFKFNWYHSRMSLEEMDAATNPNPDSEDIKDESSDDETSDMPGAEENSTNLDASSNMRSMYVGDGVSAMDSMDNRSSPTPSIASSSTSDLDSIANSPVSVAITHASSFLYIPVDEVEEAWRVHVDNVMRDQSGWCAVHTFHVFTQLYKVMQQRFCNLTREACNYLGDKLRDIALQFLSTLDLLTTHAECPYVYIDTETLITCRLLEKHKYCVIELHEHYDTYISKRDLTVECLDSIKSSLKMQSLGSQDMNGPSGDEQDLTHINNQIELCRRLYRLYFQLRMLFDSYCKLIHSLSSARQALQVTDYSQDVSAAKDELIQASEELESGQASLSPEVDTSKMTPETALRTLAEHLGNRQLRLALRLLHVYRSMWSGDMFGSSEEDDLDVLLALFCKHLSEGKTGVLVVTRSDKQLEIASQCLMDTHMLLMSSLRKAESMETKEVVISPIFEIKKAVVVEVPDLKVVPEEKGSTEIQEVKKKDSEEDNVQSEMRSDGGPAEFTATSLPTESLKDIPKAGTVGGVDDVVKSGWNVEVTDTVVVPSNETAVALGQSQHERTSSSGSIRVSLTDDPSDDLGIASNTVTVSSGSSESIHIQDSGISQDIGGPVFDEEVKSIGLEPVAEVVEGKGDQDGCSEGTKSRPVSQDSISTDL